MDTKRVWLTTTWYTTENGVLTTKEWFDGASYHSDFSFEREGHETIRWTDVSLFIDRGQDLSFIAKPECEDVVVKIVIQNITKAVRAIGPMD
jgi:hypothetical protein